MPRRRDPSFTTGHLCRFCGQLIPWGTILRIIRTDPDTPPYMLNETAAHTECLTKLLRPGLTLTFPRHWAGRAPYLDDDADILLPLDGGGREGVTPETRSTSTGTPPMNEAKLPPGSFSTVRGTVRPHSSSPSRGGSRATHPCALCAKPIAPETLVRLRIQKPTGPVRQRKLGPGTLNH